MDSTTLPIQYTVALGPEGLMSTLKTLLERVKQDPEFAAQSLYILYQLGQQRSVIKVDMSKKPFLFWYYDLLGRPMTRIVKQTIARFLWEECGEREVLLKEMAKREAI